MAVHNAERYLHRSIESILTQTYPDFECLIIDDASTDNSPAILQFYQEQDRRVRLLHNPVKRGVAWSRKRLLEEAKGRYVAVLDADDVAFPQRLQSQVEYLDTHPEIDLLGSSYEIVDEDGSALQLVRVATDSPLAYRWRLLFGNWICHSTAMYRREVALRLGGYDARVFAGEDFDLWTRFAAMGKVAQLDRPLIQWRHHVESLGASEPPRVKDHFIHTVQRSVRLLTGQEISFSAAECLFRGVRPAYHDLTAIPEACATVENCLRILISETAAAQEDRRLLISLALDDLLRLARLSSTYRLHFLRAGLRLAPWFAPTSVITRQFIIYVLHLLLPEAAVSRLKRRVGGKQSSNEHQQKSCAGPLNA